MSAVDEIQLPGKEELDWDVKLNEAIKLLATIVDQKQDNREDIQEVTAAASLELDLNYALFEVTGTEPIYTIDPTGRRGRFVTLYFPSATPVLVYSTDQIRLNGLFVSRRDAVITLFCDGSVWREVARSHPIGGGTENPGGGDPENPGGGDPTLPPEPGLVLIDGGFWDSTGFESIIDGGLDSTTTFDRVYDGNTDLVRIQVRRGTAAQWNATNPILSDGEMGLERDTMLAKVGWGGLPWRSLPYLIGKGAPGDEGDPGAPGADKKGAPGDQGDPGIPGPSSGSTVPIYPAGKVLPATLREGHFRRSVGAVAITPPKDPDPDPDVPGTGDPGTGNPEVPGTGTGLGPNYVDYTPRTIARNERADKEFLAKSLSTTDITDAMNLAVAYRTANPTKDVDVILPDGTWQGFGAGSSKTNTLENIGPKGALGAAGLMRRIRVRPGGGYGSVEMGQGSKPVYDNLGNLINTSTGIKVFNVNGFTFSEIYGNEGAFVFQACKNSALEYSHDLAYWGINDKAGLVTATERDIGYIDITSAVYQKVRVKNSDANGLTTLNNVPLPGCGLRNLYVAPVRIGTMDTWSDANGDGIINLKDRPHTDTIQIKGNALVNLYIGQSMIGASSNCVIIVGGNGTIELEDDLFVGGYPFINEVFPETRPFYPPDNPAATFKGFDGAGAGGHKSRRTYVSGGMGAIVWSNSAADALTSTTPSARAGWTTVTPKTAAQIKAMAPEPNCFNLWRSRA